MPWLTQNSLIIPKKTLINLFKILLADFNASYLFGRGLQTEGERIISTQLLQTGKVIFPSFISRMEKRDLFVIFPSHACLQLHPSSPSAYFRDFSFFVADSYYFFSLLVFLSHLNAWWWIVAMIECSVSREVKTLSDHDNWKSKQDVVHSGKFLKVIWLNCWSCEKSAQWILWETLKHSYYSDPTKLVIQRNLCYLLLM